MKSIFGVLLFGLFATAISAQPVTANTALPDPAKKILLVEASCGKCKLGLPGKSCDLAVRINGKAYYVDGADIDSYGDAHAKHGFCLAIRKAEVQGEIVNNRFKATYFKLIPVPASKEIKNTN